MRTSLIRNYIAKRLRENYVIYFQKLKESKEFLNDKMIIMKSSHRVRVSLQHSKLLMSDQINFVGVRLVIRSILTFYEIL